MIQKLMLLMFILVFSSLAQANGIVMECHNQAGQSQPDGPITFVNFYENRTIKIDVTKKDGSTLEAIFIPTFHEDPMVVGGNCADDFFCVRAHLVSGTESFQSATLQLRDFQPLIQTTYLTLYNSEYADKNNLTHSAYNLQCEFLVKEERLRDLFEYREGKYKFR